MITASIGPEVCGDASQRVSGAAEAVRTLDAVAGHRTGLERGDDGGGQLGLVADERNRVRVGGGWLGGAGLVEEGPEAGIAAALGRLGCLRADEGARDDGLEDGVEGAGVGHANDLNEAWLVDDSQLGTAGEQHLARAPAGPVADQVGAERGEVLGSRHGVERQPATAPGPACLAGALECGGDHRACWRSARSR